MPDDLPAAIVKFADDANTRAAWEALSEEQKKELLAQLSDWLKGTT